jgi:hypothetical protein
MTEPAPVPTRITDWKNPRLPLLLKAFNAIGEYPTRKLVSLDAESMMARARKQTGLEDFGDGHFLEGLEVLLAALRTEAPLSAFGRLVARHFIVQLLATSVLFESSWHIPSYAEWYKQADRAASYAYLKRCLKALQFLRRKERWLLKTPEHLMNLDALVTEFPDATFVQTHRDPVRITASLTVMIAYGSRMQQRGADVEEVARYWSARTEDFLRASVRDRDLLPPSQVVDVHFNDFIGDMKGTVKRVFECAGHPYTEATDRAIDRFLEANPKGKHGIVNYRLEDLGIEPEERRQALSFYRERFGVAQD